MTLLGFKERFVPNVEAGYAEKMGNEHLFPDVVPKRHSIRRGELRHMVGKPIQLYRNVRQKSMRKIVDVDPVCVKTEQIIVAVETDRRSRVLIERPLAGHWEDLSPADVLALAKADGFTTAADFYAFFVPVPGDHFRGHIIHWDWT